MEHAHHTALTRTTWDAYRSFRLAVLALGPVVTVLFTRNLGTGVETASVEAAVALLWSPLFFSIPALLLQNERDAALPLERNFLVRGIKLIPHLLARTSPVRVETAVSVASWVLLLAFTGTSVLTVAGRIAANLLG